MTRAEAHRSQFGEMHEKVKRTFINALFIGFTGTPIFSENDRDGCTTETVVGIGGSFVVDCSQGKMDPMTDGMVKMWGVFSEMERNIISQRVISGMKNASAKAAKIGRPEVTKDTLPDKFWKYYSLYKKSDMSITDFAKVMDASRTTIYKYIKIAEMD